MAVPTLAVGSRVFYRHPERCWEVGVVTEVGETAKGLRYSAKAEQYEEISEGLPQFDVHRMIEGIDQAKPDDLLQLTELHVSVLLAVLRNRFMDDNIYTNIGSLIIAVNPFKWSIPEYKPERGLAYIEEGWEGALLNGTGLRPHSWAVANKSYWDMRSKSQGNQSILISGESGAGKTEGAKIILRYLGDLCVRLLEKGDGKDDKVQAVRGVNERLQTASPILEAFGNAKTTRNDNSSRFGKFMKMQFNAGGILVGMHITPYLLEKSRVVKAGPEERLYHAFYQLAFGATPEQRTTYELDEPKKYKALQAGGCLTIPKVSDSDDYQEVLRAMDVVGFSPEEIDACWRVVAACLHLSCVVFQENDNGHSKVVDSEPVEKAARMLKVNPEELGKGLITKTLRSSRDVNIIPLNRMQASDTRNSLCMMVYERNFDRLIEKINAIVSRPDEEFKWIGLLDIFGFENFEKNSFEQLCINLANEKLQNHYNTYVYEKEIQECKDEGIKNASEGVAVNDNKPCLDLIMGAKDSILSILDDRCKSTQKGDSKDDQKFLDIMVETFGGEQRDKGAKRNAEGQVIVKRERPPDYFEFDPRKPDEFSVHHYAGKVRYSIAGFVGKNIDLLSEQIKDVVRGSEDELIATLMPPAPAPGGRQTRATVSGTFKKSLTELLNTIQSTKPNWVRCIRPNPQKVPDRFHTPSVLDQLTCSGVVETVKARQQGFSVRIPFEQFSHRYSICGDKSTIGEKQRCQAIFSNLGIKQAEGQVGKTLIFLKAPTHHKLEDAREKKLRQHSTVVQSFVRWRRSCVVVLDRRWTVMGRKVQKWAKFVIARDEMLREHFKVVLGKLLAEQKKERETMVKKELTTRQEVTREETTLRLALAGDHKKGLAPLWAAVIVKAAAHESVCRTEICEEEEDTFVLFGPDAEEDRGMCTARRNIRLAKEEEARREQRWVLEVREQHGREGLACDELELREGIRQEWLPVNARLQVLIKKVQRLNAARERKLDMLRMEMEHAIKQQIKDERRAYKEERVLWQRYSSLDVSVSSGGLSEEASFREASFRETSSSYGAPPVDDEADAWLVHQDDKPCRRSPTRTPPVPPPQSLYQSVYDPPAYQQEDASFLSQEQSVLLGPVESVRQEQRFYSSRAPSAILTGDPGLASVNSYKDYGEYWREAYHTRVESQRLREEHRQQHRSHRASKRYQDLVNNRTL